MLPGHGFFASQKMANFCGSKPRSSRNMVSWRNICGAFYFELVSDVFSDATNTFGEDGSSESFVLLAVLGHVHQAKIKIHCGGLIL